MKRIVRTRAIVLLITALASAPARPTAQGSGEIELRAAMETETVRGDLTAAIKRYRTIVDTYSKTDRAAAAMALLRMAACYEKLGDRQARTIYEQLARDYADQKELAATARARLARDTPPPDRTATVNRQIWKSRGDSVSSDGRFISYVTDGVVSIHDVVANTDRHLTEPASGRPPRHYAEISAISRDGRHVAYSWSIGPRYQLRATAAGRSTSLAPKILIDNPDILRVAPLDWSPDGQTIAVRMERADRSHQMALVSLNDGKTRVLKSVGARGPTRLSFAPDGKFLAYEVIDGDQNQRDIVAMRTDASQEAHIVEHPANDALAGWSPDGGRLLFVSNRSGASALWSVAVSGGRTVGEPVLLRSDLGALVNVVGTTQSGALLYVQTTSVFKAYVATVDFETGKLVTPGAPVLETYLQGQRGPVWSPDGRRLAWASPRATGPQTGPAPMIHALGTASGTQVAAELAGGVLGAWAPDGGLTYSGTDLKGRPGIFRVDPRDGRATTIATTDDGFLSLPSWSSDGRILVYRHQNANASMVLRDMASGTERNLFRGQPFGFFAISPDGKTVAYSDGSRAPRSVHLLAIDTGATREIIIVPETESISGLRWLPDSGRIAVWKSAGGKTSGSVIALDGRAPVPLDPAIPEDSQIHPDGKRIAYTAGQRTLEVWALENFLPSGSSRKQ